MFWELIWTVNEPISVVMLATSGKGGNFFLSSCCVRGTLDDQVWFRAWAFHVPHEDSTGETCF